VSQSPNRLLADLPAREYRRMLPMLRTISLSAESPLPHCGHTRVYFPGTGLCSIINRLDDGSVIEVASVGNEGLVGLSALMAECPSGHNAFVQVGDGTAQYMPAGLFERELARNADLRDIVDGYCQAFLQTMIQSVACNRLHSFQERCCRWLLAAHERLGRVRFELKARFLVRAMGGRNTEVAAVLMSLEQLGLITHDAESVTIVDGVGLRRLACRCYDAMKSGYGRAGPATRKRTPPQREGGAKILPIRPGVGGCTLCGSSAKLPHKTGHECLLALDDEIATLTRRAHALRTYRAQLLANRAQMFRDILKRSRTS
jgi:hypothetical protein